MQNLCECFRRTMALAIAIAIVSFAPGLEAPRLFALTIGAAPGIPVSAPVVVAPRISPVASLPLGSALPATAAPLFAAPVLAAAGDSSDHPRPATPASLAQATPAAPTPKAIDSAVLYRVHGLILSGVAALGGGLFSVRPAGLALTQSVIQKQVSHRRAVLSDLDDTLTPWNKPLSFEMVEAIKTVRAMGKDFAVISDRGDLPKPHQRSVFETLDPLPPEARAGMYVATESGGRIHRYDQTGQSHELVLAAPVFDEAQKETILSAVAATEARLREIGAELHSPSLPQTEVANKIPTHLWNDYNYGFCLKVGTSEEQVRAAARLFQDELAKRDMWVEVMPGFPKDPTNPPYVEFKIVTKQNSTDYIAKALSLKPKDVVILGDYMYAPQQPDRNSWLTRLGEFVSGRVIPRSDKRTDANMEKALPGALTLGVGKTGDPRIKNLWLLGGGPDMSWHILTSMAIGASSTENQNKETFKIFMAALVLSAVLVLGYDVLNPVLLNWIQQAQQQIFPDFPMK